MLLTELFAVEVDAFNPVYKDAIRPDGGCCWNLFPACHGVLSVPGVVSGSVAKML